MSDPYISRPMVIAAGIVFPVVDMVFVATRFLIKLRRAGGLGVDDYLILSAFVSFCNSLPACQIQLTVDHIRFICVRLGA